jgi:hypothetical protein
MSEWQPIETAPRDGTWCVLEGEFRGGDTSSAFVGQYVGGVYPWRVVTNDDMNFDSGPVSENRIFNHYADGRVYHWMPLPPPPMEQTNAD